MYFYFLSFFSFGLSFTFIHKKAQNLYCLLVLHFCGLRIAVICQYKLNRAYAYKVYSSPASTGGLYTHVSIYRCFVLNRQS